MLMRQGYITNVDEDDGCQWIMKILADGCWWKMIMMIDDEREYSWGSMRDKVRCQRKGIWDMRCEMNERCEMKWLWLQRNLPTSKCGPKFWVLWKTKLNPQIVGTLYCGHARK